MYLSSIGRLTNLAKEDRCGVSDDVVVAIVLDMNEAAEDVAKMPPGDDKFLRTFEKKEMILGEADE
jgi:hypothetical protein